MPTNTPGPADPARPPVRTVTGAVESHLPPAEVVQLIADASRLPAWAPGFADRVERDAGTGWRATKGDRRFALQVLVDHEAGTVDYLRTTAPGQTGGAYLRTTPRPGDGSVTTMTIPVLPGQRPVDTAAVLESELAALAGLLDSLPPTGTAHDN